MDESVVPGPVSGGPGLVLLRRVVVGGVSNPMVTLAILCYILYIGSRATKPHIMGLGCVNLGHGVASHIHIKVSTINIDN